MNSMNSKLHRINRNELLCLISFIPMLKLPSVSTIFVFTDTLYDFLRVIIFIVLGYFYFNYVMAKRIKTDSIFWLTLFHSVFIIIVTFIYGGSVFKALVYGASLLMMYFWLNLFYRIKKVSFGSITFFFTVIMIADIVIKTIYPNGLYTTYSPVMGTITQNWLLGYKNNYFPVICFAFLITTSIFFKTKEKWSAWEVSFCLLCLLEIFYVSFSGSAIFATSLLIPYFFLRKTAIIKSKKIIFFYFALNVLILLIFVLPVQNNYIFLLAGQIIEKDSSLVSRFYLWRGSIIGILQNPVFGWGLSMGNLAHPLPNWNSHNRYLWALLTGGILDGLIFTVFLLIIARKLYFNYYSKSSRFLGYFLFMILVAWQVEVYENWAIYIYGILIFIYYACEHGKGKGNISQTLCAT